MSLKRLVGKIKDFERNEFWGNIVDLNVFVALRCFSVVKRNNLLANISGINLPILQFSLYNSKVIEKQQLIKKLQMIEIASGSFGLINNSGIKNPLKLQFPIKNSLPPQSSLLMWFLATHQKVQYIKHTFKIGRRKHNCEVKVKFLVHKDSLPEKTWFASICNVVWPNSARCRNSRA